MNQVDKLNDDVVHVLGYLNFSSGKSDPQTLSALNNIFGNVLAGGPHHGNPYEGLPGWESTRIQLETRLQQLSAESTAFANPNRAANVIKFVFSDLLPAYLDFHSDLLFHQEGEAIYNGLFIGRAIESTLQHEIDWESTDCDELSDVERSSLSQKIINALNDFVGYRPVAVLEGKKIQPYQHEFLRPIPIFIRDVGVAAGSYYEIAARTIEILRNAPDSILRAAYFDLDMLDELALDPRAYDFDHPVNKRPNYHFGLWDPDSIDHNGYYRRFVIQQVTVDGLLARLVDEPDLPRDQLLYEAAAVLAGTILMASGVAGWGPGTFPSTIGLGDLLAPIAEFRDQFYSHLLDQMTGQHADRLIEESRIRRQPFGGARQHLNAALARKRAAQLEQVLLARLYGRMGSPKAAREQSESVDVPSARFLCQLDGLLTKGNQALQRRDVEEAATVPSEIRALLISGIECGAIIDPWNLLGFAGNFARFSGPESAVHDHRADELIHIMELLFSFMSRLWRESAAQNNDQISQRIELEFQSLAEWWRKYAAHTIEDLEATDPLDSLQSAKLVARALRLWHQGDAEAGNVGFWAPHAEIFDSPKAYALVIEALLERGDFVVSRALIIHWLSQAETVGLQSGSVSFADIAKDWLYSLQRASIMPNGDELAPKEKWKQIQKFFDYLEANGESLCGNPVFLLSQSNRSKPNQNGASSSRNDDFDWEEDEEDQSPFSAAYEDVVYRDSTDDGIDGAIFEEETDTQDELVSEAKRLNEHLSFQAALAMMWKQVAMSPQLIVGDDDELRRSQIDVMLQWCKSASQIRTGLLALNEDVQSYRMGGSGSNQDAMSRYDKKRVVKESLLDDTIAAAIETSDARRMLLAAVNSISPESVDLGSEKLPTEDKIAVELLGALMASRLDTIEELFSRYIVELRQKKLLYLPLARNGTPQDIFFVRLRRRVITNLLAWLPRQGFFHQACQLVDTARFMEHQNPVGPGAVTEFDELFQIAYKSMVGAILRSAFAWEKIGETSSTDNAPQTSTTFPLDLARGIDPTNTWTDLEDLVDAQQPEPNRDSVIPILEKLTEVLLGSWLSHSRTLRLSILETIENERQWNELVQFIETYGVGLFTQNFLKLSNIRAILHQGVEQWLTNTMLDDPDPQLDRLVSAIQLGKISLSTADRLMTIVLESIVDHYSEYRDYNSTTTQSDRGEMLYMLLDFLRLRVRYDRVSWNLRPVFWSHEVLVRNACPKIAKAWRQALSDRISRESSLYLDQLAALQSKYAMRMPTIADRLNERFVKPMTIDRLRALIRPSMRQLASSPENSPYPRVFELLIQEANLLTQNPTGVGLDVPAWLLSLEEEVADVQNEQRTRQRKPSSNSAVQNRIMSPSEISSQLDAASKQNRMLK